MKSFRRLLVPLTLAALAFVGCASGSAIVTGTKRPPLLPGQVVLYLEPPARFEVIGLVSASSDSGWTEQAAVDYAVRELKMQAARLGANGLVLSPTVGSDTSVVGNIPVTTKTVQGRAIYVQGVE
jgi:hypothetical protein